MVLPSNRFLLWSNILLNFPLHKYAIALSSLEPHNRFSDVVFAMTQIITTKSTARRRMRDGILEVMNWSFIITEWLYLLWQVPLIYIRGKGCFLLCLLCNLNYSYLIMNVHKFDILCKNCSRILSKHYFNIKDLIWYLLKIHKIIIVISLMQFENHVRFLWPKNFGKWYI